MDASGDAGGGIGGSLERETKQEVAEETLEQERLASWLETWCRRVSAGREREKERKARWGGWPEVSRRKETTREAVDAACGERGGLPV